MSLYLSRLLSKQSHIHTAFSIQLKYKQTLFNLSVVWRFQRFNYITLFACVFFFAPHIFDQRSLACLLFILRSLFLRLTPVHHFGSLPFCLHDSLSLPLYLARALALLRTIVPYFRSVSPIIHLATHPTISLSYMSISFVFSYSGWFLSSTRMFKTRQDVYMCDIPTNTHTRKHSCATTYIYFLDNVPSPKDSLVLLKMLNYT